MKASDVVKVKNISKKAINLSKGRIEADKTGEATVAELQCHGKTLKAVSKSASEKPAAKKESNAHI